MKTKWIILILYLSSFINIHSEATPISFTESGTGYSISENTVTITGEGTFELTGESTDKNIIISSPCTLNLNSFSLINSGTLTPILIKEKIGENLVLPEGTSSTLGDSETNENEGTIYLQKGASLTISGTGTLNINPKKNMAINGTEDTTLTVNEGPTIKVESTSSTVGGIYLRKEINFNNVIYTYNCQNGKNHAIDTEGTVKLVKGTYSLTSGNGKGIQAEKYLIIGEENGNNADLKLTIKTSNEGIEAMGITINSGSISIEATEDGINAAAQGTECDAQCSGNCVCYITFKGGDLYLISGEDGLDSNGDLTISGGKILVYAASSGEDQPIDQDGLLSISGGSVIASGSSSMGGVNAQTTQTAKIYTGTINANDKLEVIDSDGGEILNTNTPKGANYIYFNYKSSFIVKVNDVEITLSEPSQNQQLPGGGPNGQGGGQFDPNSSDRQPGMPGDPNSSDRQPGMPGDPNSSDRQPGMPGDPNSSDRQPGMPGDPNSSDRQPGMPGEIGEPIGNSDLNQTEGNGDNQTGFGSSLGISKILFFLGIILL